MPEPLPLAGARRAALTLSASIAVGGSAGAIVTGTGGLAAMAMLPHEASALATLPISTYIVGSALTSVPAALIMRRIGRRAGFVGAALLGSVGAALAAVAIAAGSFWWFVATMLLLGAANAFGQQYRFAAADAAEPAYRPRAIAWVMAGGVVTGVVGPQVSIHARGLMPAVPFAGPFLAMSVLFVLTALLLWQLQVPPPAPIVRGAASGRPLGAIVMQPRFLVALAAAVVSYALMSLVMTATPLAMVGHGHSASDSQLAIQWHVIAMFAPSFFTGALIVRLGKATVASAGLLLIAGAATVALMGTSVAHFWISLILLGLGWNFGFVAATAMVTELYTPEEAFKVQAVNDFILFGIVALASFASGGVLNAAGWTAVNLLVYPAVIVTVAMTLMLARRERLSARVA